MTAITPQLFVALALFAFVSSITPGPNNTMLLASGANFGLRRTVPHLVGVMIGFFVLILCVGLGLGGLFAAYPVLHTVLKVLGGFYLLYLAFKIATAHGLGGGKVGGQPQTFWQAAAFQWINPKAWAMALSAVTTYAPPAHYVANVAVIAAVFAAINIPCVTTWAAFGMGLRRFLDQPKVLRAFNLLMAALLVLSLYPIVADLMPG
jgi:threonine/homoserine/homoserine lactone efflux protein